MKIAAVTACPTGVAHTMMAAEALRRTAAVMGHGIRVETQGSAGAADALTAAEIADADVVILASDIHVEVARFAGKPIHAVRTSDAIRHTREVIEAAAALVPSAASPSSTQTAASAESVETSAPPSSPEAAPPGLQAMAGKRLVGITACPTGIAHTFMAAEALQKAAAAMGHTIKVETQGSVGARNQLTPEDIAAADAVVVAADTKVDTTRFAGKPVYVTSTKQAIKAGREAIGTALAQPAGAGPSASASAGPGTKGRTGPYKHLMTGVSYMLPVVIAGGLAIALAFALGGIYAGGREGTLAWALSQIGGGTAFHLFVAVLSGFIAFSIADRPGLAPGLVGGMLAQNLGAGFLGGIVSGFLAGYLTKFLADRIRLPVTLEGLKPVLILPFLSTILVGLAMIFVIAPPVQALNTGLNDWLLGLRGANAVLLGLILGTMMAVDMGGPLNKAAYTFAVGLLASRIYAPMAAVMAAGMTPALGVGLAAFLFRSRFDEDERKAGGPAVVLGLSFITEGAIPFAARDPLRVIPALVLGSAVAGGLSMLWGVTLLVPHGGVFAALIPGAVSGLPAYLGAIALGTAATAGALFALKRPLAAVEPAGEARGTLAEGRMTAIRVTAEDVRLAVRAADKESAIRAVGGLLAERGYVDAGYVESMLGREGQANTYLGSGIAIPHGMGQHRDLIHRTGVAVVQVPEGVEWADGQIVRLVVGIAARSDEHLAVLAALTDVLDDPVLAEHLGRTGDPAKIAAGLTRGAGGALAPAEELADARHVDVRVEGAHGLHARPATFLVDVAMRFESEVRVGYQGRIGNAKALAALLKLGVEGGETIRIFAAGPDADQALAALREAVEGGLGEEAHHADAPEDAPAWDPVTEGRSMPGVPASPGLAIGPVYQFQATRIEVADRPVEEPAEEKRRLKQAIEAAREQLADLYASVEARSGKGEAMIFRAHQALILDPELHAEVEGEIDAGHGAAWAWQRAMEARAVEVGSVDDERLAARATDLHDVGQRVLALLAGTEHGTPHVPDHPVILVADDLTPSHTARLDPQRILGLCTASGGPTSHTAIIARSLGIPAVVGAGPAVLEQPDGTPCILDGTGGRLYLHPTEEDLESARGFQADLARRRDTEHATRYQPAILRDGHRVEIAANIGSVAEAEQAVEAGAEGVGLMRSEFLFLGRDSAPTEEEQYEAYAAMARAMGGLPLIIRTLDIGGDKVVPYLSLPEEDNPFLGIRGIRLCLRKPELFIPQLRAIYRAAAHGHVRIMFPMIATLEELRAARAEAEKVRAELGAAPVEIGIMVEVPSAVLIADALAQEVDFFSIGTNDLTQYVLAMDRMHPTLGAQVDGLHPAVLRMIDMTVRAADRAGRWVGVCGGIAGDPVGALILTGLGVAELSMSLPSVAAVKASLRRYSLAQARRFAEQALARVTAPQVRALPLP